MLASLGLLSVIILPGDDPTATGDATEAARDPILLFVISVYNPKLSRSRCVSG